MFALRGGAVDFTSVMVIDPVQPDWGEEER